MAPVFLTNPLASFSYTSFLLLLLLLFSYPNTERSCQSSWRSDNTQCVIDTITEEASQLSTCADLYQEQFQ